MLKKLLTSSFLGTVGMTLFSWGMSVSKKEKFLEPLVLNQLLYPASKKRQAHHPAGYVLHWLVGLLFSVFYCWRYRPGRFSLVKSSLVGLLNGLVGVAGWQLTLTLHPKPPRLKLKPYYLQLLAAHTIFGLLNGLVCRLLQNKR